MTNSTSLGTTGGPVPGASVARCPRPSAMRGRNRLGHPIEPFDPAAHPRKLNLGSGFTHLPGH